MGTPWNYNEKDNSNFPFGGNEAVYDIVGGILFFQHE